MSPIQTAALASTTGYTAGYSTWTGRLGKKVRATMEAEIRLIGRKIERQRAADTLNTDAFIAHWSAVVADYQAVLTADLAM